VKVCWALSGVYDMRRFMGGMSDDNFYFNNPVDYIGGMNDSGRVAELNTCDLHLATGSGPWERPGDAYQFAHLLSMKGIRHSLDDWGPQGGHDWPYWTHQMWEYPQIRLIAKVREARVEEPWRPQHGLSLVVWLKLVWLRMKNERQAAVVDVERAPECTGPTLGLPV